MASTKCHGHIPQGDSALDIGALSRQAKAEEKCEDRCWGEGAEAKTYTLCNSQGQRDNWRFVQPVAAERLTPVDILPMSAPADDVNTRISLQQAGVRKDGTIVSQRLDGIVYIAFDDDPDVEVPTDLTKAQYHWT